MKHIILQTILVSIFLTSCLKEELPVPAHQAGDVITTEISMEEDYKWQIYYDLETNEVVGQNLKTVWDLGFTCCSTDNRVVLNGSKAMFVYPTGKNDFTAVTDTVGYTSERRFDAPSGHLDSTALNDWETGEVFIIDRGYSPDGAQQGFYKIQIHSATSQQFEISYGPLTSTTASQATIERIADYNYTFFNLEMGSTVDVEPPKTEWDIVFTQYLHIFKDPQPVPYLVTGCMLNRYKTSALKTEAFTFDQIDLEIAQSLNLVDDLNEIGYNWKTFVNGSYELNLDASYIVQNQNDLYYKIRFIDFYDDQGVKGTPTFEVQSL